MKSFAYYGTTVVTEKDWIRTKNIAQSYPSQMTVNIINAIDDWAKSVLRKKVALQFVEFNKIYKRR